MNSYISRSYHISGILRMRNNDEFNKVTVNNDGRTPSFEFGNTQKIEYSSYQENKSVVNRDELNKSENVNNENVKVEQSQTNNTEVVKKVVQTTSETGVTTTSGIASTATTASASIGHVVVGAAVVAVTTVATVAGINVISRNNASVTFDTISIGETSLIYYLELKDSEGDPFSIFVENDLYSASKPLEEGFNEGYFDDLTNNTRYRLYIQEQNDNKKVIYDTYFVTGEEETLPESEVFEVTFSSTANYMDYSFDVTLNYADERNVLSDFKLTITDLENSSKSKVFDLEKTTEVQHIDGLADDETVLLDVRNSSFKYRLDYVNNGSPKSLESDQIIKFDDNSGHTSEFRGVDISDYANFDTFTFDVTLDVVDDFGYYSSFVIYMTNIKEEPAENEYTVELRLGMIEGPQTFDYSELNPEEPDLLGSKEFKFVLEYDYKDETISEDLGQKKFINSAATMEAPIINEFADFATLEFEVTLTFTDEFSQIDSIQLYMVSQNTSTEAMIPLDHTLDTQTIEYDNYNLVNPYILRTEMFDFTLIYNQKGKEMERLYVNDVSFSDKEEREPSLSLTIQNDADFVEYSFNINVDLYDPFHNITNAMLTLVSGMDAYDFELDIVDGEQTISCVDEDDSYIIDMVNGSFTYIVTYYTDGNLNQYNNDDTFQFYDYDYNPAMQGGAVYEQANFFNNTIYVKYDYVDVYNEAYTDFRLVIQKDGEAEFTATLSKTRQRQAAWFDLADTNIAEGEYYVQLMYHDVSAMEDKAVVSRHVSFEDEFESYMPDNALDTPLSIIKTGEGSDAPMYIPVCLDYSDPEYMYDNFHLYINEYDFELSTRPGWQVVDVTGMSELIDAEVIMSLICDVMDFETRTTSNVVVGEAEGNFWMEYTYPVLYGGSVRENSVTYMGGEIPITICAYDPDELFEDYVLVLDFDGDIYEFEFDVSGIDNMLMGDIDVALYNHPEYDKIIKLLGSSAVDISIECKDSITGELHTGKVGEQMRFTLIA